MSGSVFKRCGCRDAGSGRLLGRRCGLLSEDGHGSWYFSVELPGGSEGRCRLRRGGFATRAEAEAGLSRCTARTIGRAEPGLTMQVWLEQWLASRAALRAATRRSYAELIRNYLDPYLGAILVSEVRTQHVQDMFASIIARPERAGRRLTPASLQRIRATARAAFNAAVRAGLIMVNPVHGVELPESRPVRAVVWTDERVAAWRDGGPRPVVAVWTADQTAAFLHFARTDRWYPVFHLLALCGLRRGEVCGLRWEDVNLAAGTLSIVRQVQRRSGQVVESAPKSAAGTRTLALDHTTLTVLRQHRHRQNLERDAAESSWRQGGWVFTYRDGRPLAPDRLTRHFNVLVARSGLPPVRLHDLRHGTATLALAAGTDLKVVSAMLGHATIQLTADTYSSVLPDTAHTAAEKTAALIFGTRRRPSRHGHRPSHHRSVRPL